MNLVWTDLADRDQQDNIVDDETLFLARNGTSLNPSSIRKLVKKYYHNGRSEKIHTPSNLVVAHWPSEVESTAPLDFLLRHGLWTPFGCLMSCKIRSIISVACDFTTKSDGI